MRLSEPACPSGSDLSVSLSLSLSLSPSGPEIKPPKSRSPNPGKGLIRKEHKHNMKLTAILGVCLVLAFACSATAQRTVSKKLNADELEPIGNQIDVENYRWGRKLNLDDKMNMYVLWGGCDRQALTLRRASFSRPTRRHSVSRSVPTCLVRHLPSSRVRCDARPTVHPCPSVGTHSLM